MADVYLAVVDGPAGMGFTKLAVVKRMRSHLTEDPEFSSMFLDEACLSARLNHANVVQCFDIGVDRDQHFLAMEYLDGQPVGRIARRAAKRNALLPRDAGYVIVADLLRGLHYAHELTDYDGTPLHIVHRDVTPENVFVTYEGQVKLVDFGIAKACGRTTETRHGIVKGKTRYMSPEQAVGGEVDRRTDVFGAGVILWQLATARRFWGEMDDHAVIEALVAGAYDPSPRAIRPDVPDAIDAICRRALAWKIEDRYPNAALMLAELEAYIGESELGARRELVALMGKLFADDRRSRRAIIEELATSSSASVGAMVMTPTDVPTGIAEASLPLVADTDAPPAEPHATFRPAAGVRAAVFGRRSSRPLIGAAVTLLAAVGFALVLVLGFGGTTWRGGEPALATQRAASAVEADVLGLRCASEGLVRPPRRAAVATMPPPVPPPSAARRAPARTKSRQVQKAPAQRASSPTRARPTGAPSTPPTMRIDATDPWR